MGRGGGRGFKQLRNIKLAQGRVKVAGRRLVILAIREFCILVSRIRILRY